jgi:hypothetical protein
VEITGKIVDIRRELICPALQSRYKLAIAILPGLGKRALEILEVYCKQGEALSDIVVKLAADAMPLLLLNLDKTGREVLEIRL